METLSIKIILGYYLPSLLTHPSKIQLTSKDKLQQCERGKDQCRQADEEYLPANRKIHYKLKYI
jgi:hypothetical protein